MTEKKCTWIWWSRHYGGHQWRTKCGEELEFQEQKFEYRYKFCPYCGGEIEVKDER